MNEAQIRLKSLTQRNYINNPSSQFKTINNIRIKVISSCLHINIPKDNKVYIKEYYTLKKSKKILSMINLRLSLYLDNYCKKYNPNLNDKCIIHYLKVLSLKKRISSPQQLSDGNTLTIQSNTQRTYPLLLKNNRITNYNQFLVKRKQINHHNQQSAIQSLYNINNNYQRIYNNTKSSGLLLSSLPTYKQCAKECSPSLLLIQPNLFDLKEKMKKSSSIASQIKQMNIIDKYILNTNRHLNKKKGSRLGSSTSVSNLKVINKKKGNGNELKDDAHFNKQTTLYSFLLNNYFNYQQDLEREKNKENEGAVGDNNPYKTIKKTKFSQFTKTLSPNKTDFFIVNKFSNIFIRNKILKKIQKYKNFFD